METRARNAATASRAKSADSDRLLDNYLSPGLAGQPISTIDNSRRFSTNLACSKSATMLELMVQPGATGDLMRLSIARDANLDGTLESNLTLPVPVSGVCANGIISCRPGSWDQCRPFKWSVDQARAIGISPVPVTELAGCYCLNNSCGPNLAWGNMAGVLKDLGGGVVGALTSADPRIGVAQAQIDGSVIRYTGAQTTACTTHPTLNETRYKAAPALLAGDAETASAASSLFKAVKASPAGLGKAQQVTACSISREISFDASDFDDILGVSGPIAAMSDCGEGCRRYRLQGDGSCSVVPPVYSATLTLHKPERLVSAHIVGMGANDWVQGRVNGVVVGSAGKRPWLGDGIPSGDCSTDGEFSDPSIIDVTPQLQAGPVRIDARVRGGNAGRWGYVDLELRVDTSCSPRERIVNLCAGYAGQSQCRLKDETVDDVDTVRNGIVTGLSPLPQTRSIGTGRCETQVTRSFFERERHYACAIDTAALPPPDLSRGAYIIDRSTETLLADQTRSADGAVAQTTRAFSLPSRPSVAACEPICKTRAATANSGVASETIVAAQQNLPTGWDFHYHSCEANNVCPAGPVEEIVSPCGCLDDFPEAVVMMQTVRLAGADLACTAVAR